MAIGEIRRRLRLGVIGGGSGLVIGEVRRILSRLDVRYEIVNATNPAAAFNFTGCGDFESGGLRLRKRTIRVLCQIRRAPNIKSNYERGTIHNVRP